MREVIAKDAVNMLKSTNIDVLIMAYAKLDADWHSPVFSAPYTRIYFVTKGSALITVNGKEITLTAGNIYVIPYGCKFSYKCDNILEKLYFHIVYSVFTTDIMANVDECIIIKDKSLFDECLKLYKNDTPYNILLLEVRLKEILLNSLKYAQKQLSIVKHSAVILKTLMYIDDNLRYDLTVSNITNALFMSESTLNKQFKREMGISIGKYITDRVLTLAEEKVRLTKEPILNISENYGFRDQFYFSRLFAKKYGVSPTKYRKFSNF